MNKLFNTGIKLKEEEYKYYTSVIKYGSFAVVFSIFLITVASVLTLVPFYPMITILSMLLTIYLLIIVRTEKIGTKDHIFTSLLLFGIIFVYGFNLYTMVIGFANTLAIFILLLNGLELRQKKH